MYKTQNKIRQSIIPQDCDSQILYQQKKFKKLALPWFFSQIIKNIFWKHELEDLTLNIHYKSHITIYFMFKKCGSCRSKYYIVNTSSYSYFDFILTRLFRQTPHTKYTDIYCLINFLNKKLIHRLLIRFSNFS